MNLNKKIKLTEFSPGAGWACKISANDLTQVLSKLNSLNINKSIGFETFDDCSIYPINDKQSIIQSVDFFTPIVDDPYLFGQIAATNALSDIYAMGGKPLFALNIVAFPTEKLNLNILSDILNGGIDKCKEVNIPILGGHSIKDDVPKYGLAVTGIIDNNQIIKNNTAKYNDDIILTKPIGTGIITTAIKKNICGKTLENKVIEVMNTLNNKSAEFNALDKITARTKKLEIRLNEEENLGSLIIILKSCLNRPPDYLPESAAYIEIFDLLNQSEDKQNLVFSGWMFSSSPAISALEHPIYDISLVSCK